jgi:hypothetical protein
LPLSFHIGRKSGAFNRTTALSKKNWHVAE